MNEEPTYLNLTPNLRVFRTDDRNLELEEYRSVTARKSHYVSTARTSKKWVSIGYYSDLPQAVHGALKAHEGNLIERQKMDLENVVLELRKISSELIASVKESGIKLTDFVKIPDGRGKKSDSVKVAKVKDVAPVTPKQRDNQPKKRGRGRPRKVR